MAEHEARMLVEASTEAVVIRCRCNAPESHQGRVCPKGVSVSLGRVAYWHRNPIRRGLWAIKRRLTRSKGE